jgi:hypothetical protein
MFQWELTGWIDYLVSGQFVSVLWSMLGMMFGVAGFGWIFHFLAAGGGYSGSQKVVVEQEDTLLSSN